MACAQGGPTLHGLGTEMGGMSPGSLMLGAQVQMQKRDAQTRGGGSQPLQTATNSRPERMGWWWVMEDEKERERQEDKQRECMEEREEG